MAARRALGRNGVLGYNRRGRLACERLEDRRVLSITVDTLVDTDVLDLTDGTSLREAVILANAMVGPDTIDFSVTGTIELTEGELLVSEDLTINGPGRDNLTIDGQQDSRLFHFTGGAGGAGDLEINRLSLINGQVSQFEETGGGINFISSGTLTINDSRISGNSTLGNSFYVTGPGDGLNSYLGGGAIFSSGGSVAISGSELSDNYTYGDAAPGGAVNTNGGNLTVTNSTITGNATMGIVAPGGAIFALEGEVQVTGSTLTMNRVEGYNNPDDLGLGGGAIAGFTANVTVEGSDVSENAVAGALTSGGGIGTFLGAITVRQSTINNNTLDRMGNGGDETAGGAGLSSSFGSILIEDSTVSGNINNSDVTQGGGVYAYMGSVTVLRSTIAGNRTTGTFGRGGGVRAVSGDVTVTDSTISGNSTAGISSQGGGIALTSGNLIVENSTVSGNSTSGQFGRGAGVYNSTGDVTLSNSTVIGNSNTSGYGGGGVHVRGAAFQSPELTILNTVVAGNTSNAVGVDSGNDIVVETAQNNPHMLDVSFSLIGDNTGTTLAASATPDANGNLVGGTGASVIDPMLGALADNGGPTLTHLPDAGSPLFDAGDPLFDPSDPNSPSNDQRGAGFARVAGGRLDIGAVETPVPDLMGDYNQDRVVNAADFTVWRDVVSAPAASFPTVDGDDSGTIDLGDYGVWAENFVGSGVTQTVAAAATPPIEIAGLLATIPTDASASYTPKTTKTFAGEQAETSDATPAAEGLLLLSVSSVDGEPTEDSTQARAESETESEAGSKKATEEAFAQLAVTL